MRQLLKTEPDRRVPFINRMWYMLIIGISAKLLVDTSTQIYNPFLVIIGAGIGVSTVTMGRLVALRGFMGIAAPLLGSLADRIGYKAVMRLSLVLAGLGMILGGLSGNVLIFTFSMIIGGIGSIGYTPNLHAYLSTRLPYEKRAMGLGIVEYSWALAGIVGLFISGLLISSFGWNTPFFFLGGGLLIMAVIYRTIPPVDIERESKKDIDCPESNEKNRTIKSRIKVFFSLGEHAASAWGTVLVSGLAMFAMMHIVIIHGAWLGKEYGVGPAGMGTIALVLGLTDLAASVSVSLFADRIGKRRSVMIGAMVMTAGFAVFPFFNRSLVLAVLGIMIPRTGFEFAVVSNFSLLSEQIPQRRGQILGMGMTAGFLGSTLAGLTGPLAYLKHGVWGLGPVSFTAGIIALLLLIFVIREQPGVSE